MRFVVCPDSSLGGIVVDEATSPSGEPVPKVLLASALTTVFNWTGHSRFDGRSNIPPASADRHGTLLKQREPNDGTYDGHDNAADNNQFAGRGLCCGR